MIIGIPYIISIILYNISYFDLYFNGYKFLLITVGNYVYIHIVFLKYDYLLKLGTYS